MYIISYRENCFGPEIIRFWNSLLEQAVFKILSSTVYEDYSPCIIFALIMISQCLWLPLAISDRHSVQKYKVRRPVKIQFLDAGFGDAVNCEEGWKTVERYVDEQFNKFFQDESGLNRKNIQDHRVHCCLYFVPPYGHGWVKE